MCANPVWKFNSAIAQVVLWNEYLLGMAALTLYVDSLFGVLHAYSLQIEVFNRCIGVDVSDCVLTLSLFCTFSVNLPYRGL